MKVLRNGSKELIKEINRFKVLNIIRQQYPISRSEITKHYKLGTSTLSYIIEDLKELGWINEVGEQSSTGGRRAKLLEFNQDFGFSVGIKIEERQILIALTNMEANLLSRASIPIEKGVTPEHVVKVIEEGITTLAKAQGKNLSDLLGIGVLSSGLVNRHNGTIIRSSMLGWRDVPITEMLKVKFPDTQIFVDNNINGYTLAELTKGEGKENNNFLVVSVGAGIGLSVVIDRKIYYGSIGGAGEYGHTTLVIDGYPCHCGQRGCLEMYASEFYFENRGQELVGHYPETAIGRFSFTEVATKAREGDELALALFEGFSKYLGHGIRNLINTFNPDKIVMAGEGMEYSELFMEKVQNMSHNNFFSKVDIATDLVESTLKDEAWLEGASLLAINHIFQEPIYEKAKAKS